MDEGSYEFQIAEAKKVHARIPETLKNSPIILSKPDSKIYHKLKFRDQTEEEKEYQKGLKKWLDDHTFYSLAELDLHEAAVNFVHFQIPYLEPNDKTEFQDLSLNHEWGGLPNFHTLKNCLDMGHTPFDSFYDSINDPIPLHQAMLNAKTLGYFVPDSFLIPKNVREDKKNAYYAARHLRQGQIRFFQEDTYPKISSLSTGFLVPDPDDDTKIPFVIDQLWVIRERNAQLRFLALEIDNEFDLKEENLAKSKLRDEKLARQGIEVYHAAGWWCMVDSWRVISEFLAIANVYPRGWEYFHEDDLISIKDYICQSCEKLMTRWDDYWIQEVTNNYDNKLIVHGACADNYY